MWITNKWVVLRGQAAVWRCLGCSRCGFLSFYYHKRVLLSGNGVDEVAGLLLKISSSVEIRMVGANWPVSRVGIHGALFVGKNQ